MNKMLIHSIYLNPITISVELQWNESINMDWIVYGPTYYGNVDQRWLRLASKLAIFYADFSF